MPDPETTLTHMDVDRLSRILRARETGCDAAVARQLQAKIASSPAIPAESVPPDLVTMNSVVVFEDERTGKRTEIVIAYPRDADPWRGRVSILSPVSASLLGLKIGQSATCTMPDGKTASIRVVDIKYQPEKAGHLHL